MRLGGGVEGEEEEVNAYLEGVELDLCRGHHFRA